MKRLLVAATVLVFGLALAAPHRGGAEAPTEAMGPHMDLTLPRPPAAADQSRAATIVSAAKRVMARYPDVASAERDGFAKFLPGVPLAVEHFTNNTWAVEAWTSHFDAEHPTSLIYERHGEALHLVGVMYTASKDATQQQLDAAVPLSVARWHRHVRICLPPRGAEHDARFGLAGTISDADACRAAGGRWLPQLFGWMVHVWPDETDPARVWAVHHDDEGSMHDMTHMH